MQSRLHVFPEFQRVKDRQKGLNIPSQHLQKLAAEYEFVEKQREEVAKQEKVSDLGDT